MLKSASELRSQHHQSLGVSHRLRLVPCGGSSRLVADWGINPADDTVGATTPMIFSLRWGLSVPQWSFGLTLVEQFPAGRP